MKILLIADEESKFLWDYYQPGKLDGIDLIISCGDLKPEYLQFLVTMCHAPLYYVHGNHDDRYENDPPDGCVCIEDEIVTFRGLRILGLGGCPRYSPGKHQYSERQMRSRIRALRWQLWRSGGVDIVVSHAPLRGWGDADDLPHRGFECFNAFVTKYHPRYWFYGHVHMRYNYKQPRILQNGMTTLINACERYIVEIKDKAPATRD